MKTSQGSAVLPSSRQISCEPRGESFLANMTDKVQNLIEYCLQKYMNRDEAVNALKILAEVEPVFTITVWQRLEQQNAEFFEAYYAMLMLKKQINMFNKLLKDQYDLMNPQKAPLAPMQNGIHCTPGCLVQQQRPIRATGEPQSDCMDCSLSGSDVVNKISAPGNFRPTQVNGNKSAADSLHVNPTHSVQPDMGLSHLSVAYPSDISGIFMDVSEFNSIPKVASSGDLQPELNGGTGKPGESVTSLARIPWNISLTDLTDLPDLEDHGELGNDSSPPFLPSGSDILVDYLEQDDTVDFLIDPDLAPSSQSDEMKS